MKKGKKVVKTVLVTLLAIILLLGIGMFVLLKFFPNTLIGMLMATQAAIKE